MKQEQENFDSLQRLLKLKRYEQPPPRYFNEFSGNVISRIRAAERSHVSESWLSRLFGAFEPKAALAWTGGIAACALFLSGVVMSETVDYAPGATYALPLDGGAQPDLANSTALALQDHAYAATDSGTNNSIGRPSLFDQIPMPGHQTVGYPLFQ